ncbi:MAG: hypothetical protein JKX67_04715 [Colwellia sp.]|nr:hypothetical protein [Colwellia sp.]
MSQRILEKMESISYRANISFVECKATSYLITIVRDITRRKENELEAKKKNTLTNHC